MGAITRFFRAANVAAPEQALESVDSDPNSNQASEIPGGDKTDVCTIDTDSDQDVDLCDKQNSGSVHDKSRHTSGPILGIDLAVLAELPPAIQAEVRAHFQQQQLACSAGAHGGALQAEQSSAKRLRTG